MTATAEVERDERLIDIIALLSQGDTPLAVMNRRELVGLLEELIHLRSAVKEIADWNKNYNTSSDWTNMIVRRAQAALSTQKPQSAVEDK